MEEKEMIQESPREEERFKKGVLVGILATVAVFLVAVLIVISVVKDKYAVTLIDKEASDTQEVLDADSEKKIKELLGQMELYYYEDIDTEELTNGLYKGLFEGLGDPYSVYYTKEEYDSMMASTSGTYCGIGAVLSQDMKTMQVTVLHVYKDTPADKAGLKDGDTILKVDDIEATSMELSELVTNIRGDKGTKVHLEVYREGEKDKLEYDIERDKVEVPTVEYEMLENNVGYI